MNSRDANLAAVEAIDRFLDSPFGRALAGIEELDRRDREQQEAAGAPGAPSPAPAPAPAVSLVPAEETELPEAEWLGLPPDYDWWKSDNGREGD